MLRLSFSFMQPTVKEFGLVVQENRQLKEENEQLRKENSSLSDEILAYKTQVRKTYELPTISAQILFYYTINSF